VPEEVRALMEKFKHKEIHNTRDLTMVESYLMDDADICLFAYGAVARSARKAVQMLRREGYRAGLLRPQIIWPFPKFPVEQMLEQVRYILVPEMNVGHLRKEVERLSPRGRDFISGINVLNSRLITAAQIVEKVKHDVRAH
jgi:2-oxoglutarate ferredoxin oxidoreductase subunit alpha